MKIMKKLATLLLTLCLVLPAFPIVAEAANGAISFTDPSTTAGEVVEVACALRSSEGSVDGFNITLQYDPAYLTFQGGDGITAGDPGVITYYGTGDGSNLLRFTMQFQALQAGSTAIQVVSATATTTAGDAINCTSGASTITIAEGTVPVPETPVEETPVEETPVEETPAEEAVEVSVGEKKYTLSEAFDSESISEGFEETTGKYDGTEYKMVQQTGGKAKLAYLVDEDGEGNFFLYDEEKEAFAPFVQVAVSATSSIILLQDVKDPKLPENYKKTDLTVNSYDFPAWQDLDHKEFYLVYAMDLNGEKAFYQYDEKEGSYQRFAFVENFDKEEGKEASGAKSPFTPVSILFMIALATAVGILAIRNRKLNEQLDDLYDEYGIEEDVIRLDGGKEEDGYLDDDDDDIEVKTVDNSSENKGKNKTAEETVKDTKSEKEKTEELDDLDDDFDFDDDDFDVDFLDLDE